MRFKLDLCLRWERAWYSLLMAHLVTHKEDHNYWLIDLDIVSLQPINLLEETMDAAVFAIDEAGMRGDEATSR